MLKVHMVSGDTIEVDLTSGKEAKEWMSKFRDPKFSSAVTGLTVVHKGVQYSLPRPIDFRKVAFAAEPVNQGKGGERIFCFADETCLEATVHHSQRAVRMKLTRPGKLVYAPGD